MGRAGMELIVENEVAIAEQVLPEVDESPFPDVTAARILDVVVPVDLDRMGTADLIDFARSMISLNRTLVRGWNVSIQSHQEMGAAVGAILDEWADFAGRFDLDPEDPGVDGEEATETRAAGGGDDPAEVEWINGNR